MHVLPLAPRCVEGVGLGLGIVGRMPGLKKSVLRGPRRAKALSAQKGRVVQLLGSKIRSAASDE